MEAIRRCVARGRPYGGEDWVRKTAGQLGLESTLRAPHRPRSPRQAMSSQISASVPLFPFSFFPSTELICLTPTLRLVGIRYLLLNLQHFHIKDQNGICRN